MTARESFATLADIEALERHPPPADTTPYGDSGTEAFAQQARLSGIELVAQLRFKVGDSDMSGLIKRARAAGAS